MSPKNKVSQEQAEAVLEQVKAKYPIYLEGGYGEPQLRQDWWDTIHPDTYTIDWEEGPEDWAMNFHVERLEGGKNIGVYTEAYNHFVVAICPMPI